MREVRGGGRPGRRYVQLSARDVWAVDRVAGRNVEGGTQDLRVYGLLSARDEGWSVVSKRCGGWRCCQQETYFLDILFYLYFTKT